MQIRTSVRYCINYGWICQRKTHPFGWVFLWLWTRTRRGRPCRRQGKKVSGGHFFSPWESPLICRRIRYGCGCESNILRKTIFLVRTRKRIPIGVSSFLFRPPGGKGLEHSNATVRWTVAHARLDGHDTSVFAHSRAKTQTSPFRVSAFLPSPWLKTVENMLQYS